MDRSYGTTYPTEKSMQKQLYRLDALTPSPQYVGPARRETKARSSRKKTAGEANDLFHLKCSILTEKKRRLISKGISSSATPYERSSPGSGSQPRRWHVGCACGQAGGLALIIQCVYLYNYIYIYICICC